MVSPVSNGAPEENQLNLTEKPENATKCLNSYCVPFDDTETGDLETALIRPIEIEEANMTCNALLLVNYDNRSNSMASDEELRDGHE